MDEFWDEIGTLRLTGVYEIRTDPLWILIICARQGHCGPWEEMEIEMQSGQNYGPSDIERMGLDPTRKGHPLNPIKPEMG